MFLLSVRALAVFETRWDAYKEIKIDDKKWRSILTKFISRHEEKCAEWKINSLRILRVKIFASS